MAAGINAVFQSGFGERDHVGDAGIILDDGAGIHQIGAVAGTGI
jgi:hypothetical protein